MIPKECKRLAEVDFPIAVVSKHAAKEKSIRHGHPSTLHLWWARRPLAACRAMLLALLLPDPCDEHCPEDFKAQARTLLPPIQREVGPTDHDLRQVLLKFIGDFANWDLSANPTYLSVARGLVKAAHGDEPPLVVDPFAGGGSIPLEALRLGCDAFASDLNPVACLILKVMLEDIPRRGPKLAEELRRVGAQIKAAAEKELAEFYPPDPDGARPIAYLWARTVRCESPNCGAEIPLIRSFWLARKKGRRIALRYNVIRGSSGHSTIAFEIIEPESDGDVQHPTISLGNATCPICTAVLPKARVRAQLTQDGLGASTSRLLAVVTISPDASGRRYRLPNGNDLASITRAERKLAETNRGGTRLVPDEPLPARNRRNSGFGPRLYGAATWDRLFSTRQQTALTAFVEKLRMLPEGTDTQAAVKRLLAISFDKMTDLCNSVVPWKPDAECPVHMFSRQAIGMAWDWCESVPICDASGSFMSAYERTAHSVEVVGFRGDEGSVQLSDASSSPLPDASCSYWFTDPPYYDSVAYADLSDFFFVWLKRLLPDGGVLRDPFDKDNRLTPKREECIENEEYLVDGKPKDKAFFENKLARAFAEGRRVLVPEGIGCVVFAHKTTEGWEALLAGMLRGGWTITASWPITTEMATRMVARDTAALAASVHLVCRPRPDDAPVGDWADVLRELPKRVGDWMERLQSEGVRGADLVFACIGPALEIYSRYAKVVDAEEREIPLGGDPEATEPHKRGYLAYVWEAVGRAALEQVLGTAEAGARNCAAGALEEDARLTALFLWTLQSTDANGEEAHHRGTESAEEDGQEEADEDEDAGEPPTPPGKGKRKGLSLIFDVVRRFAQPLGIHLPDWEDRIIQTDKGVVRLLPVAERAKQLFGEDGAEAVADQLERNPRAAPQLSLFPDARDGSAPAIKGRGRKPRGKNAAGVSDTALQTRREATTLDRVHAAMLLQAGGRANALRALLKAEQDRGPDFLRLANALSALYPKDGEEKRLLDAMLLAVPR